MAVGGDIREVTDNHPTLGSFVYKVKASEDNTYDTGGFRSNDDANMVTGGKEMITQINAKLGFLQVNLVNDMTNSVAERLASLAASPVDSVWTFTAINGVTYRGKGRPVGDINPNINTTIVAVKIASPEFKQV